MEFSTSVLRKMRPPFFLIQTLRVMKLIVFLLLVSLGQLSAGVTAQSITYTAQGQKLEKVFAAIKQQTGYVFFYKTDDIRKAAPVTLDLQNAPLESALNTVFKDQPLNWSIKSNTIVVTARPEVAPLKRDALDGIDIHGRVLNENGQPMIVNIMVKGTTIGTVTNEAGEFTLKNIDERAILMITGMNIETLEVKVKGQTDLFIIVRDKSIEVQEVVISTGYSQVERRKVTGAAATLTTEELQQRDVTSGNFIQSLEGKISGVVVDNQTGDIAIRGVSTFDAVKKPLIVLDGFPTEIDIRSINPTDIVSVNVLKDAAAAAIYGARASNGVIIIETRRGKSGLPKFNFSAITSLQPRPNFDGMKLGSALEYAQIEKDFIIAAGQQRSTYANNMAPISPVQDATFLYNEGVISADALNQRLVEIGKNDNLDQLPDLFFRNQVSKQINFDVSGGSDNNTYLIGLNYLGEDLQNQRSDNSRILLNLATTHKFTERIKLDFHAIYNNSWGQAPGYNFSMRDFYAYEMLADENGNALPVSLGRMRNPFDGVTVENNEINKELGLFDQQYYPYQELYASTTSLKSSSLRLQARLNAKLTQWLSFDLGGAFEDQNAGSDYLQTLDAYNVRRMLNYTADADPVTGLPIFNNLPVGDILTRTNSNTSAFTLRGQFNVNLHSKDIKHVFAGIAGAEVRKTVLSSNMNSSFGYSDQTLIVKPVNFLSLLSFTPPAFSTLPTQKRAAFIYESYFGENWDDNRFVSLYSEGTYTYNNKYGLSGSIRFDKTNLFGTDPRYRNTPFYSLGANWRVSRESFMEQFTFLNDLKLRAAFGVNGNIPTSNNGPFLLLEAGQNYYILPSQTYYDVISPENQSMRWEKSKNLNLGLDFSLFEYKLTGTLDYYHKNSEDLFGIYSADPTSGFNQYSANTSSILNQGVEFSLSATLLTTEKMSWISQLTAAFNENEVTKVKVSTSTGTGELLVSALNVQQGYPLDALFAYDYAGLNNLGQPEIYGADGERKMIESGADGNDPSFDDLKYMGTTIPKYTLGLNNYVSYDNFSLSFLFMYFGGYVTRVEAPDPSFIQSRGRLLEGAGNYWKAPGDELNTQIPGLPELNAPGYFDDYARAGYTYASQFVHKADHIRLRDVALTYAFNPPFMAKTGFSNTQIRLQVQDALIISLTDLKGDPDAIDRRSGVRTFRPQPVYSISLSTSF